METGPPSGSGSGSSSAAYPRWVMLEQYLDIIKVQDSASSSTTEDGDDAKTVVAAPTSAGHLIQVSLRLADPPALSRVFLRIPDGVEQEKSKVLAAHGDSVLIQVQLKEKHQRYYMTEHFVYNAGAAAAEPSPRPPSLWLLPPYYERTYYSGSDLVPRELSDDATGLLRRGEDELVVAELRNWFLRDDPPRSRVGEIYLFPSGEWKKYYFKIRDDWGIRWVTWNTVVPVDDRLLCWVDFCYGVVLIDVFNETPSVQYIQLPMDPRDGRRINRNVCTTAGGGTLKFVNIFGRCCCGAAASCDSKHSHHAYTIHTWTLKAPTMDGDMEWVKDGMVDATELWAFDAYKGLPCDPLDRPIVSTNEPEIICFRMRDTKHGSRMLWQIMVNMRSKIIHSVSCHEAEVGYCYARDKLIPSNASYFFNTLTGIVDEQLMIRDDHSSKPMLQPSEPISVQALLEKFEALREIPSYGLGADDQVKAYRILINSDDDGRLLTSLARLPKDIRKDWLLMEIKATDDCCTGG